MLEETSVMGMTTQTLRGSLIEVGDYVLVGTWRKTTRRRPVVGSPSGWTQEFDTITKDGVKALVRISYSTDYEVQKGI